MLRVSRRSSGESGSTVRSWSTVACRADSLLVLASTAKGKSTAKTKRLASQTRRLHRTRDERNEGVNLMAPCWWLLEVLAVVRFRAR
jgi:hypothetical protein